MVLSWCCCFVPNAVFFLVSMLFFCPVCRFCFCPVCRFFLSRLRFIVALRFNCPATGLGCAKFRAFFPVPLHISSLSWGSSRGILVVFEAAGPSNVNCRVKPRRPYKKQETRNKKQEHKKQEKEGCHQGGHSTSVTDFGVSHNSKCTFEAPGLEKTPPHSTRRPPREGRQNEKCGGRVKKSGPAEGGPGEGCPAECRPAECGPAEGGLGWESGVGRWWLECHNSGHTKCTGQFGQNFGVSVCRLCVVLVVCCCLLCCCVVCCCVVC